MAEGLALEPQLKEFLMHTNLLHNLGDDSGIAEADLRAGYQAAFMQSESKIPVKNIINKSIPGIDKNQIPVRIYQPFDASLREHGLPVLVYCHGGGFFAGNLDSHDDLCRNLVRLSGYILVAVDYRLAPEHKFPAGHEDGYAAAKWAHDNASTFGGDASQLAIGGDSAGASIAAAVCHMARRRGGPKIVLQVLIYPTLQPTAHYTTDSMEQLAVNAPFLSKRMLEVAYDRLIARPEDQKHELLDLIHAPSMTGLPPAFIVTAEFDPLRDEGEQYASRLSSSGVQATLKCYDGTCHGFVHFNSLAPLQCAVTAFDDIAKALHQAMER